MENENKRIKYNKGNNNIMCMPNNVFRIITDTYSFKLYCYLCSVCNENGEVRESATSMADNTSISRRKIIDCINELESLGLITKELTNDNATNLYTLYMPTEDEEPAKKTKRKSNRNP